MSENYLYETIKLLRQQEKVLLFGQVLQLTPEDEQKTINFLHQAFEDEQLAHPAGCPHFHPEAALWAAKWVYHSAQFILYRQHELEDLESYLVPFAQEQSPSALVSADLCLRFLPHMLQEIRNIDNDDPIISLMEKQLLNWPYSALMGPKLEGHFHTTIVFNDPFCLHLFANRVVQEQSSEWLAYEPISAVIKSQSGMYAEALLPKKLAEKLPNERNTATQ